jgi:hypothetical protein
MNQEKYMEHVNISIPTHIKHMIDDICSFKKISINEYLTSLIENDHTSIGEVKFELDAKSFEKYVKEYENTHGIGKSIIDAIKKLDKDGF